MMTDPFETRTSKTAAGRALCGASGEAGRFCRKGLLAAARRHPAAFVDRWWHNATEDGSFKKIHPAGSIGSWLDELIFARN
jgi:hypothetical protein